MNKKLLHVVWIVSTLIALLLVLRGLDVEIEHFEDGAGKITYCLPFDDAGPYWGGCN